MTRPMPGPPDEVELYRERWIRDRTPWRVWWKNQDGTEGDLSLAYALRRKRLTDAECAAEYWRAGWIADHDFHDEHEADEASTWHRFATRPHADLNGDPQ